MPLAQRSVATIFDNREYSICCLILLFCSHFSVMTRGCDLFVIGLMSAESVRAAGFSSITTPDFKRVSQPKPDFHCHYLLPDCRQYRCDIFCDTHASLISLPEASLYRLISLFNDFITSLILAAASRNKFYRASDYAEI